MLALGLALRLVGIDWGVPRAPHFRNWFQDERFTLGLVLRMDPSRLDLDPRYYINPGLHYYSLLKVIGAASILGLDLGLPVADDNPFKPSGLSAETYRALFSVGRGLSVLLGAASLLLLFLIGRRLYDERAGLWAALLGAVAWPLVYESHFLVVDGPAVFWLLLGFWAVLWLDAAPDGRRRLSAPVLVGLAIGAKYLNVLLVLPLALVLWRAGRRGFAAALARTAAVASAAFLLSNPYSLLSLPRFLSGDAQGFGGIFGARGLFYYNSYPPSLVTPLWSTASTLGILGSSALVIALAVLLFRRSRADRLLLLFILPFYLLLFLRASPMMRHFLPLVPFLCLALAGALRQRDLCGLRVGPAGPVLLGLVAAGVLALSASGVARMARPDTREQAAAWLDANAGRELILLPTWFPFRYTPAIDSLNVVAANYNPVALADLQPRYVMMVEPEYRVWDRRDPQAAQKTGFRAAVERDPAYRLLRRFRDPFKLFGLDLAPRFPAEDWDFTSPEILLYRRAVPAAVPSPAGR
ncbi:MAG: glycosyltransferase family 39 protein [bacterium]